MMFLGKLSDHCDIKGISQCVREDDGSGARAESLLQLENIHIVGFELNVQEDRDKSVLYDGVYGRREACCHSNHLVARLELPCSEGWRCQHRNRQQICGRSRITNRAARTPTNFANLDSNKSANRPAVSQQSSPVLNNAEHVLVVKHPARNRNR